MAEFCPVIPAGLYKLLDVSYPGGWHFVHAPQVVGHRQSSSDLVKFLSSHHCTVILDCFAYELDGQLPCFRDVYEAAAILRDSCDSRIVVCPDVLRKGAESFELLRQHGPALSGYGQLMIVPHGADLMEWMSWAERCLDFCRSMGICIPLVGLPRYMSEWGVLTRYKAATWIYHYFHANVHLLGAGIGLSEVQHAARAPSVMSCDSTLPFAYAMKHGILERTVPAVYDKIEMDPDWWHLDIHGVDYGVIRAAQVNIALWKEALRNARNYHAEPYLCV